MSATTGVATQGAKNPELCAHHARTGLVYVKGKNCGQHGCKVKSNPSYATPEMKSEFCPRYLKEGVASPRGKSSSSPVVGSRSGQLDGGRDEEVEVVAPMRFLVTKKRSRQAGAATQVAIAIKTEAMDSELARSSSRTSTGTRERARPTGCTPSAPLAVKAETARKRAVTPAESVSSKSESGPQVAGEIGVTAST